MALPIALETVQKYERASSRPIQKNRVALLP